MTPNIIISSTFDEDSNAKKKNFSKIKKKSPDPEARLSPVQSLVVSDDKSTLGQADRDPPAKEGQTDLTSEEQTDRQPACATTMFTCAAFVQFKLQISHLKYLDIIHDANSNSLLKMSFQQ